jgi:hypothetical protein
MSEIKRIDILPPEKLGDAKKQSQKPLANKANALR